MSESDVAAQALALARATEAKINGHEDLCAARYLGIHSRIDEIKTLMKWFGGTIFALLITVLGWSLNQNYRTVETQSEIIKELRAK